MTIRAPFGSWPSPITARLLAAGTTPVGSAGFAGNELWWLEGRPAEGGRLTGVADEDKVVPPSQSEAFVDALAAKGIPHAYVVFPGEKHGFRKAENIVRAHELTLAFYAKVFGFDTDVPEIELDGSAATSP